MYLQHGVLFDAKRMWCVPDPSDSPVRLLFRFCEAPLITYAFHRWSAYATNCSTVYVQTFPDPLPAGVRVPNYAYLDVTV